MLSIDRGISRLFSRSPNRCLTGNDLMEHTKVRERHGDPGALHRAKTLGRDCRSVRAPLSNERQARIEVRVKKSCGDRIQCPLCMTVYTQKGREVLAAYDYATNFDLVCHNCGKTFGVEAVEVPQFYTVKKDD